MPSVTATPADRFAAFKRRVDKALQSVDLPEQPAALYDPVRYVLAGGGKRLRPALVLLSAQAFGADEARALPAALAVEVFHNFTLVHDDIMDHAAERRGRPTVHVKWDESTAILAGDLLMGMAYDLLAQTETDRLGEMLRVFGAMLRRLCEGQTLDEQFENTDRVTVGDYLRMIEGKTGALLECAMELGGLVGGASSAHREALRQAGADLGRAFQIQDDLLDLTADHAALGKRIGGDLIEGKKTYLLLRALEAAKGDEHAWFARIPQTGGLPPDEVDEARRRMARLGVLDEARQTTLDYYARGEAALDALPQGEAVEALRWLARQMGQRIR